VNKVRATVDKALDTAINFIISKAKALFKSLFSGKPDKRTEAEKQKDLDSAIRESESLLDNPKLKGSDVSKKLPAIQKKYKLTALTLVKQSETKDAETDFVTGEVNPKGKSKAATKPKVGGLVVTGAKVTPKGPSKVAKKGVTKATQERLAPVEQDWRAYEVGAMQNVVVGQLIPEWEQRTGVPITTGERERESAQYMARFKTQKAFNVGGRRPRPEGRVEILEPGGKGAISHVFAVEVTTVHDLTTSSHKLAQISNTVETLLTKYGTGPQIEYTIVIPHDLTGDEQSMIDGLLNRPDAIKMSVVWVKTGK